MVKILLVDDEERMLRLLDLFLSPRGYFCISYLWPWSTKINRTKRLRYYFVRCYDAEYGWMGYLLSNSANLQRSIIMLTARNQNYDMVKGLTMGADDYITKPFDEHVLVARIEAILRRTKKDGFVSFNGIEDKTKHTVTVYDEKISLTPIEFSLLRLFYKIQTVLIAEMI